MSNSGARRVVTSDGRRAPRRFLPLSALHRWRASLGPAVGGILAAVQAALITYLTVTVPAVATYIATSGNPDLAHTAWADSLRVGTDIWLLGHGGATSLDGAAVTIIPLGITLLALLALSGTFRRTVLPTAPAWFTAVVTYPVLVVVLGAIFSSSAGRDSLWRASIGALLIALIGITTGWARHEGSRTWADIDTKPSWLEKMPEQLYLSLRGGALALCVFIGAASVLAIVWIVQGQAQIGDVLVGLGGDWLSIFILGAAQLLIVPTLVLWAFAWIAGPGFTLGEGTLWAPDAIASGPLPAFPILGALPEPDSILPGNWIYLVAIAAGVIATLPLLRRHRSLPWYWSLSGAVLIALTAGLGALTLGALAAGSLGPGRMVHVGPDASALFLSVSAPILLTSLALLFAGGQHAQDGWRYIREKSGGPRTGSSPAASPQTAASRAVSSQKGGRTDSKSDPYSASSSKSPQNPPRTSPAPKQ